MLPIRIGRSRRTLLGQAPGKQGKPRDSSQAAVDGQPDRRSTVAHHSATAFPDELLPPNASNKLRGVPMRSSACVEARIALLACIACVVAACGKKEPPPPPAAAPAAAASAL